MVVFHVDANSAYLSWTAAAMLEQGYKTDIRTIPAVIAGDPENRHGFGKIPESKSLRHTDRRKFDGSKGEMPKCFYLPGGLRSLFVVQRCPVSNSPPVYAIGAKI